MHFRSFIATQRAVGSGNIPGSSFEGALHHSIKPRIVCSLHVEGWTFVKRARAVCSCGALSVVAIKDDEVAHFHFLRSAEFSVSCAATSLRRFSAIASERI